AVSAIQTRVKRPLSVYHRLFHWSDPRRKNSHSVVVPHYEQVRSRRLLSKVHDVRRATCFAVLENDALSLLRDGLLCLIGGSTDVMSSYHVFVFENPVLDRPGAPGRLSFEYIQTGSNRPFSHRAFECSLVYNFGS